MDNLQARYSFYTKLYKKYSPDLSDEEIGQEVRNLSHAENQQESIDNFYKNVVGKPVTAKQRVKISQFVDPQATQGIIVVRMLKIKPLTKKLKLNMMLNNKRYKTKMKLKKLKPLQTSINDFLKTTLKIILEKYMVLTKATIQSGLDIMTKEI